MLAWLDPLSRARVWEEVRRLNDEMGVTVFLTTQYLEEADELEESEPEELDELLSPELELLPESVDESEPELELEPEPPEPLDDRLSFL